MAGRVVIDGAGVTQTFCLALNGERFDIVTMALRLLLTVVELCVNIVWEVMGVRIRVASDVR